MKNIVNFFEQPKIIEYLEKTLKICKEGGKSQKNSDKKRTQGGIFIELIKQDLK